MRKKIKTTGWRVDYRKDNINSNPRYSHPSLLGAAHGAEALFSVSVNECLSSLQPPPRGALIAPILKMGKLRLREFK